MRTALGLALATLAVAVVTRGEPARALSPVPPPAVVTDSFASLAAWEHGDTARVRRGAGPRHDSPAADVAGSSLRADLGIDRPAISLDVRVPRGGVIHLGELRISRGQGRTWRLAVGDWRRRARGARGWRHVQVSTGRLAVDGRRMRPPLAPGADLAIRGDGRVSGLVATRDDDARALLVHRVAALHAAAPRDKWPLATDRAGGLHYSNSWTTGFWPGALWRASDLTTRGDLFMRWARAATKRHLKRRAFETHDLGFMYGHSSVAAYERRCHLRDDDDALCFRLLASGLDAAAQLAALADSNRAAGTIPTRRDGACSECPPQVADTIIDSLMNLRLLTWAATEGDRPGYRDLALQHAAAVARLMIRDDGSTFQSVHFRRSDGAVLKRHTHQGFADEGTWSRGQAWAIFGYAQTAGTLDDAASLATAERVAAYFGDHLPASGLPLYDFAAPPDAPVDASAAVIAAAGLYRLGAACARLGGCAAPDRWRPLADRLLGAALGRVRTRPPLGFLGDQVYTYGGSWDWDDDAELVFGLDYALEAVAGSLGRTLSD